MSLISFWIIFYTMQLLWENLEKMFHSFKPHHPSTISREAKILVNTITLTFYGTTRNSPLKLLSGKSFKRWNYFHHTIFVWFFTERWCENQTWMNERPTKTEWKFSTQKRKWKISLCALKWSSHTKQAAKKLYKILPHLRRCRNFHVVWRQHKNMWKIYF